jgi:hypothetical protein
MDTDRYGQGDARMSDHEWLDNQRYGHDPVLPTISPERLFNLLQQLKPLYRNHDFGAFNEIVPEEFSFWTRKAMTWDPPLGRRYGFVPKLRIATNHGCGYHGILKPSAAEALAFAPAEFPAELNAFYIDTSHVGIYPSGSGHRLETVFGVYDEDYVRAAVIEALETIRYDGRLPTSIYMFLRGKPERRAAYKIFALENMDRQHLSEVATRLRADLGVTCSDSDVRNSLTVDALAELLNQRLGRKNTFWPSC